MLIAETRREYTRDSLASCEQQYKGNNIVDYEKLPNVSELRAASFKLREDTFVTTVCFFFRERILTNTYKLTDLQVFPVLRTQLPVNVQWRLKTSL